MIALTLKLLLAHILGDFVFQPSKWVKHKQKHKIKSPKIYWHILIHAFLLLVVLQFNLVDYWLGFLIILVSHYVIDLGKLYAQKLLNDKLLFFLDQALHLIIIGFVLWIYEPFTISLASIYTQESLLLILFILLTTYFSSICIKVLIAQWKPTENEEEAMKNAGAYIGMLERLFIFGFIVINYWEGIGFLLAAKSIFRFGDISNAKDRNLTEYVLVGTLLSFGMAILIGLGYNYLSEFINKY